MKQLLLNNPKITLFCLGCLSALAMAPVYAWPLMMIGYCALLSFLTKTTTWRQAGIHTFLFFFGCFLTSLYWVSSSLFVDLQTWWWALPFSFMGLPFILALFPTVFVCGFFFLTRSVEVSRFFKVILIVLCLIIADIARGNLFTGFPWNLPAHTWTQTDVMMNTLPHIGFWGLNSLTIILFCLPVLLQNKLRATYIVCLISICLIPIQKSQTNTIPDNVIMIQANIPQHEKWDRNYIWRNFDRHVEMSLSAIINNDSQIIIWPETAISQNFITAATPRAEFLRFLSSLPKGSILISGYLSFKNDHAYNSIAIFNRDGEIISQYDKHHLVPFGEYMPFGLDTVTGFSNFSSGEKPQIIDLHDNNFSFLPLICYESVFSRYLPSTVNGLAILNITNDSWFGNTAGPYQHFDHMIFRTIESGRPAIRLSGNGLSGIINKDGIATHLSMLNKISTISNK